VEKVTNLRKTPECHTYIVMFHCIVLNCGNLAAGGSNKAQ